MESYALTVRGRDKGVLLQNRTTVLLNGPVLSIKCDAPTKCQGSKPSFVRVSIDRTGSRIAAGDSQGNIYIFDRQKDKYWFLHHLDRSCSSISFTACRKNDLMVASSFNCAVYFFNTESCAIRETSHLHKTCVNHIVTNADGLQAITSSLEVAIVWDVVNVTVLNKIRSSTDFEIIKVVFLPVFNNIAAAFKNGKVVVYKFQTHEVVCEFTCRDDNSRPYWLQTFDVSNDGKFIACGGKKDEIAIWSMATKSFLYSLSLSSYLNTVKQIQFLSATAANQYVLSVLSHDGKLQLFDLEKSVLMYRLDDNFNTIMCFADANKKVAVLTTSAEIQLFDLEGVVSKHESQKKKSPGKSKAQLSYLNCPKRICRDKKKPLLVPPKLDKDRIKQLLQLCGEYPSEYRQWIWSYLLKLPQSNNFSALYKQENINKKLHTGIEKIWIHKVALRIHSMLVHWCPFISEIDYVMDMIRPFIIEFHRNIQMCFELIVTYISNWCQNWFWYLPLLPINILYAIENLLLYHDRQLLHHFLIHDVTSEIYGFSFLKTSFYHAFKKEEWFKLWDHIFSEPPDFTIFIVIALNTLSRNVLLKCLSKKDIAVYFNRWSLLASTVIEEARLLRAKTPPTFDPLPIIGAFTPLESTAYALFNRFSVVKCFFPTLARQTIVDDEIESLLNRKNEVMLDLNPLHSPHDSNQFSAIQQENLLELKKLHDLMNSYVLQSAEEKQVERLRELDEKVKRLQKLMQRNLLCLPKCTIVKEQPSKPETSSIPSVNCLETIKSVLECRRNLAEKNTTS